MKKQMFTPLHFKAAWLRLLLFFFLSTTVTFLGCDKAKEAVSPASKTLQASQTHQAKKDGDADDKYKTDKTGQYVSKSVQVTGYEDGRERPSRPKYDIQDYATEQMALLSADCIECNALLPPPDEPCDGCGGGGGTTPTETSTFVSSVGRGIVINNMVGYIYSLRIISGDNSAIQPSIGHIKIDVDLNKGAGGKYIYLTFTRDTTYTYENDGYHKAQTFDIPLTNLKVVSYAQLDYNNPFSPIAPTDNYRHLFKFTGGKSIPVDLNDGAGGKYIFGHVSRLTTYGLPIKEVGILYGNSSSIQPPAGWVKVPGDLNENAGGDYIYFCFKK